MGNSKRKGEKCSRASSEGGADSVGTKVRDKYFIKKGAFQQRKTVTLMEVRERAEPVEVETGEEHSKQKKQWVQSPEKGARSVGLSNRKEPVR